MSFSFKGVDPAKSGNYLKPGYYRLKPVDVTEGTFPKGIPYIEVTFQTKEGQKIGEKYALKNANAASKFNPISRLVYLHEAWLGKEIDQDFKSAKEIAAYFKKVLCTKPVAKTVLVGGEKNGKIVYARLPLTDYVIESDVELGAFATDSEEYKEFVRDSNRTSPASNKKGGLLNDDDDDEDEEEEEDDDAEETEDAEAEVEDADDDAEDEEEEEAEEEEEKPAKKTKTAKPAKAPVKPAKAAKEDKPVKSTKAAKGADEDFDW